MAFKTDYKGLLEMVERQMKNEAGNLITLQELFLAEIGYESKDIANRIAVINSRYSVKIEKLSRLIDAYKGLSDLTDDELRIQNANKRLSESDVEGYDGNLRDKLLNRSLTETEDWGAVFKDVEDLETITSNDEPAPLKDTTMKPVLDESMSSYKENREALLDAISKYFGNSQRALILLRKNLRGDKVVLGDGREVDLDIFRGGVEDLSSRTPNRNKLSIIYLEKVFGEPGTGVRLGAGFEICLIFSGGSYNGGHPTPRKPTLDETENMLLRKEREGLYSS